MSVCSSSTSLSLDPSISSRKSISGVLGWINLVSGPALIVATGKQKVVFELSLPFLNFLYWHLIYFLFQLGDLSSANHGVYQLTSHEILPFARTENHLTTGQQKESATFLAMLSQTLSTPHFYFSYSCDLSHSVQRKFNQGSSSSTPGGSSSFSPETTVIGMFTQWDERFVWNRYLLEK